MLVTPTGLEGADSPVFTKLYASPGDPEPSVTRPLDGPDASDPAGLPSPLPSFLEACARLAIEAASQGDFARARELMEKAERVASVGAAAIYAWVREWIARRRGPIFVPATLRS
jgi:hypothetical protein